MSHGLLGMRERALLLRGTFAIRRGKNDKGTGVQACIPLPDLTHNAAQDPSCSPERFEGADTAS